ncbi:hypothetical protein [Massilia sp. S19_KUP03_FR1]|uniref:hypothetical protein n=1 Tax=Massilia sp. S19_KUP03_FR1 TaxID=3025503 RepID=UPI002FCDA4C3
MTTIGPVQQIVAAIRAEMGARVPAGAANRRAGASASSANTAVRKRSAGLLAERVRALDPLDPERGRKAFRIFLESVLLAELGEELINDPAFYTMVDQVQRTMESSPEIAAAMTTAVARLLEPTRPG